MYILFVRCIGELRKPRAAASRHRSACARELRNGKVYRRDDDFCTPAADAVCAYSRAKLLHAKSAFANFDERALLRFRVFEEREKERSS